MAPESNDGYYEVYWPKAASAGAPNYGPGRVDSLNGKTVAFVWDHVFRGDKIFATLEKELKARYPDLKFVPWTAFGNTHGADERAIRAALPEKLRELNVDCVISGVGA